MDIAIPLFEGITALDAIGPYEVLSRLPGARVRFVAVTPGPNALTRIAGAHSAAATRTVMLSPAFDVQYAPMLRSTRRALTLDVATIDAARSCAA